MREYLGADRIEGPLLVLEGCGHAAYGELVEVRTPLGHKLGQVLVAADSMAIVELWGESAGLNPRDVTVRFSGRPLQIGVAREMLGRVFDGLGRPRDGLPAPAAEAWLDVHGAPLNPAARTYPRHVIETGLSAIDGLNTLVRGQKLAIFSGSGLPHNELAAQVAVQSQVTEEGATLAVVFAALGVSHDTAAFFREAFASSGYLPRTALFLNLADDPPMERLITPRLALTLAEFLAFEKGCHVLALLTDMTNYAEALRELSTRRSEVPGRKGYPGYLYTDLATVYERCGVAHGRDGSLTLIPVLSMPADDLTHPVPDLTGYITEGQIVLSRHLHRENVYPPIDVLPSLSRLMKDGIGQGRTRADHAALASQLYQAYARVQDVRALAVIVGEAALGQSDRAYLAFGRAFERDFIAQDAGESRAIDATLDLGWRVLALLPEDELSRLGDAERQRIDAARRAQAVRR